MYRLLLFLTITFMLGGCSGERTFVDFVEPDTDFYPILMDRSEMEAVIGFETARPLETPGKLYTYGAYIFLNERYEGIHFIDNRDRSNPQRIGFFRIPGNLDMAVKQGQLYADNGTDMLVIDLRDPASPEVVRRVPSVFPELPPPDLRNIPTAYLPNERPENTVIVAWKPINE
ncbi:MAG: hypothetical protein AAF740_08470 [Bacteroidota bacterium]